MVGFTMSPSLKDVLFPLTSDTYELKEQIKELETELGIVNEQLFEYDYDREFKESIKAIHNKTQKRRSDNLFKTVFYRYKINEHIQGLYFKVTVVPVGVKIYDLQDDSNKDALAEILSTHIIPVRGEPELIKGSNSLTITDIEPLNEEQKQFVLDEVFIDIADIADLNSKIDYLQNKITEVNDKIKKKTGSIGVVIGI